MKRLFTFGLPIAAVLLLLYAFISVFARPKLPPPTQVEIGSHVSEGPRVTGIGILEPKSEVISIGTDIQGVVSAVNVRVGDKVKAGDVLFQIDSRYASAELEQAKASLGVASEQLAEASTELERYEKLRKGNVITNEEYSRRLFAVRIARARVQEAIARVNQLETRLKLHFVTAPISGKILSVDVRPGEFADNINENQAFIRLGDISDIYVRVEVDETEAERITPTSKAVGVLRSSVSNHYNLRFLRREPYVISKRNLGAGQNELVDTRVVQLLYGIDNPDDRLLIGRQMDVFIDASNEKLTQPEG